MFFYTKNSSKVNCFIPDKSMHRVLWGITFNSPLMNSAGMFKNGEGYDIVCRQGAGGYIGGTSTYNPRVGNLVDGIFLPFITLPKSHTTINYLGLPNLGDKTLSARCITKHKKCPIGWSVMRSPDYSEEIGMLHLVESLWMYYNNPQIDFVEINESCPNIQLSSENITKRLIYISRKFLANRKRNFPVIVKLSVDLNFDNLKSILDTLFYYNFDGINLGNTSTDYTNIKKHIVGRELKVFDYFVNKFGGGVGGSLLKEKSYALCKFAVEYRDLIKPRHEFHIIRSGGIDSIADIQASDRIGVSMNQWYSGYFANYAKDGDLIYSRILSTNN